MCPTPAADAHGLFRNTRFFRSLDGLRCLSILAVIWHHAGFRLENVVLFDSGRYGVHLFFAISGFLITTLILRERELTGNVSLRRFYMRRTLRIFPLYYVVMLLYIVLVAIIEGSSSQGREFFHNLPYYLTYTGNWYVVYDGNVIFFFAWSLATEEQFYLFWPSIEKFLKRWTVPLMVALVTLRFIWEQGSIASVLPEDTLAHKIIRWSVMPPICFGVLLAHALHWERSFAVAWRMIGSRFASAVIAVLILLSVGLNLSQWISFALMALLVGSCVIRDDHVLTWFLTLKPMAHMGKVSYGMYLLHVLASNAVVVVASPLGVRKHSTVAFILTCIVAAVAATISYRYFESYFLRLKNRFAAVRKSRTEASPLTSTKAE